MIIKYTKEELLALNTAKCKKKPDGSVTLNFSDILSKNALINTFFANRTYSCRSELNIKRNNFDDKDEGNDNCGSIPVPVF